MTRIFTNIIYLLLFILFNLVIAFTYVLNGEYFFEIFIIDILEYIIAPIFFVFTIAYNSRFFYKKGLLNSEQKTKKYKYIIFLLLPIIISSLWIWKEIYFNSIPVTEHYLNLHPSLVFGLLFFLIYDFVSFLITIGNMFFGEILD